MATTAEPIVRLTEALGKLPGIGPKSAMRLAYHVLQSSDAEVEELAESLLSLKNSLILCSRCFNVADKDPCSICADQQRDRTVICVIEKPSDIPPLERTSQFKGLYHVLHGVVSPNKGIGPDNLKIRELLPRLRDGEVREVILATNPTVEGEATAMYIRQLVTPMGVKVTKLARGLPYGSDLEYADDITLGQAINSRQGF
ncbi:MAG: recombination protein RecR [Dehalococcoidia bacterium]|nr:recombination protein RecR [Dehalococcoidia bacterium]